MVRPLTANYTGLPNFYLELMLRAESREEILADKIEAFVCSNHPAPRLSRRHTPTTGVTVRHNGGDTVMTHCDSAILLEQSRSTAIRHTSAAVLATTMPSCRALPFMAFPSTLTEQLLWYTNPKLLPAPRVARR